MVRGGDLSAIRIRGREEVDEGELRAFYRAVQPERADFLERHGRWLYRAGEAAGAFPLLAMREGRVVGHAGAIPVALRRGDEVRTAHWFVDFWIVPELQRQGIGSLLSEAWEAETDLRVTFCNHRSIGVFRRKGWEERQDVVSLAAPLRPDRHPAIRDRPGLREGVRAAAAVAGALGRLGGRGPAMVEEPLEDAALDVFHHPPAGEGLHAERSAGFMRWRLREAPLSGRHFVLREPVSGNAAVVRVLEKEGYRRLHLLALAGPMDPPSLRGFVRSLMRWAREHHVHHAWCATSDGEVAAALRRWFPIVRTPLFAFHAADEEGWAFLRGPGRWEALDSDLDLSYP